MQPTRPRKHHTEPLKTPTAKSLVLLDRDGVINQEKPGSYITRPEDWVPIPGSLQAIERLHAAGHRVAILSNQSAVGRGLLGVADLEIIHDKLRHAVRAAGGTIAGIFYCPHHPAEECGCRKPKPGLIHRAESFLGCSAKGVPFVGDQLSDIEAARLAGCTPLLVRTGRGSEIPLDAPELLGVAVFRDLSEAVTTILAEKPSEIEGRGD